jgi:hypothetical protein
MNHRVVTGHHVSTTRQDLCHSICPESLEVLGVIESRQDIEGGTDEFRGDTKPTKCAPRDSNPKPAD